MIKAKYRGLYTDSGEKQRHHTYLWSLYMQEPVPVQRKTIVRYRAQRGGPCTVSFRTTRQFPQSGSTPSLLKEMVKIEE